MANELCLRVARFADCGSQHAAQLAACTASERWPQTALLLATMRTGNAALCSRERGLRLSFARTNT